MSRVATPPQTKTPSTSTTSHIPQEKIAKLAYEKWLNPRLHPRLPSPGLDRSRGRTESPDHRRVEQGTSAHTMTHGTVPPRR